MIAARILWSMMVVLNAAAAQAGDAPLEMFLDRERIASAQNVQFIVEQPTREREPVIRGDRPWQTNPYVFGTVIYDEAERRYKAWYQSYNRSLPLPLRTPVLYATSDDGRNWTYPDLGLFEFDGSRENHIVLLGLGRGDLYSPSVIRDDRDPDPARRYKMIYWDKAGPETYGDGGMFTAVSPDGLHWTRSDQPVLRAAKHERAISDVMDLMQDPATGRYVVYAKGWAEPFPSHRQIVRSESSDFEHWSEPQPVIRHAHREGEPQSYGMPAFVYEGVHIGLLRVYRKPGDETIEIGLAVSRDGRAWSHVEPGQTFLPVGQPGAWDDGMIFTAPPIVRGDTIEIFYGGWDGPHDSKTRNAAIGVATLAAGRFVAAASADGNAAVLRTTPLDLENSSIAVNVDARGGAVQIEIVTADEDGDQPRALATSYAITGDDLCHAVRWDVDPTTFDGPVSLRFTITGDARLYGYRLRLQR